MLAGVTVGGVRNGAAKEDGRWDLNQGAEAIRGGNHKVLRRKGEGHAVLKWGKGPHGSEGE